MLFIISLTQLDIMDLMWQSFLLHLALLPIIMLCTTASCTGRSLQKVQGHRAGVDVNLTQSTGGPVGHSYKLSSGPV